MFENDASDAIDSHQLLDLLPQKYPFLFVDRILSITENKFIIGIKNVSLNEPYFQGHFPDYPVMPNSLIIEGLTQTGSILFLQMPTHSGKFSSFQQIKKMEFFGSVFPGDQLRYEVELTSLDDSMATVIGMALVNGRKVCVGEITFQLMIKPVKPHIDATATVHETAILGSNVSIGPNTIVGENVIIGDDTKIEANCFIEKWTRIGEKCHIHFGCVIGSDAQDVKYKGEKSWVVIGDRNEIREYVTINRATGRDTVTEIGSDNIFLTHVHIAHNCKIGDHIIIANMTNIGGHTEVEDNAVIGGMTGIHQFVRIGKGAMVGAYTRLPQDVPPFMICEGNPATVRGLNLVGLRRRKVSRDAIAEIKEIHKCIYRSKLNSTQAMEAIEKLGVRSPEAIHLSEFCLKDSSRGFSKKVEPKELSE